VVEVVEGVSLEGLARCRQPSSLCEE